MWLKETIEKLSKKGWKLEKKKCIYVSTSELPVLFVDAATLTHTHTQTHTHTFSLVWFYAQGHFFV